MTPDDPRHGSRAGYDAHGRDGEPTCKACRAAAARYENELVRDRLAGRPRTVPATGTRRRIQALCALGFTFGEMGAAMGVSHDMPRAWARRQGIVHRSTALKVARLYRDWSMQVPEDHDAKAAKRHGYARTVAAKNGWVPPLAWDDIDRDPHPIGVAGRCAHPGCMSKPHRRDRCKAHRLPKAANPTEAPSRAHEVDEAVVERILGGDWRLHCSAAEKTEVCDRWVRRGNMLADLEALTGWRVSGYYHLRAHQPAAA